MAECFICEKHSGNNYASKFHVLTTDLISIYHMPPSEGNVYLGHVIIESERHVPGLDGLTVEETSEVGKFQMILSKVSKVNYEAEHVYAFVFGDGIDHIHVHILPRYKGAPKEFRGTKVDEWSGAPHGVDEDTKNLCRDLAEKIEAVNSKLV